MPPFARCSTVLASLFCSLQRFLLFFLALNADFPAESINIVKVRLERPLPNEVALACAWISLLPAFLAPCISYDKKVREKTFIFFSHLKSLIDMVFAGREAFFCLRFPAFFPQKPLTLRFSDPCFNFTKKYRCYVLI